jgi:hypothetical protein
MSLARKSHQEWNSLDEWVEEKPRLNVRLTTCASLLTLENIAKLFYGHGTRVRSLLKGRSPEQLKSEGEVHFGGMGRSCI